MTDDMLKNMLELSQAKTDKEGWTTFQDGRLATLYAGHDGVSLTIGKIEALRIAGGFLRARNVKGDTFIVAVADLFASSLDGGTESSTARKAGFIGG